MKKLFKIPGFFVIFLFDLGGFFYFKFQSFLSKLSNYRVLQESRFFGNSDRFTVGKNLTKLDIKLYIKETYVSRP